MNQWKGQETVTGSLEALALLRKENKKVYFVTNSSLRGRQCYPSPYFSALYLKDKHPQIKKIMTFGTVDMAKQFSDYGFEVVHVTKLPEIKQPIQLIQHMDLSVQAIVVGWDMEMSLMKQAFISFHLQNGVKFFGTNPDRYTMIQQYKVPSAGSIIKSIEWATGFTATIIGKPNTFIIDYIIKSENLKHEECIMIGDNRDTDIKFGNDAGISTFAVLTGVSLEDDFTDEEKLNAKAIPTYYSNNLSE